MKKWMKFVLPIVFVGFICLNVYLIYKDDSKAERTVYVKDWTRVQEEDIVETIKTDGMMVPRENQDVYLPLEQIDFQQFLVKEGDQVTAGTPLFVYTSPEVDNLRETFELEIQQLEGELEGVEDYIASLIDYQSSVSSSDSEIEIDSSLEEGFNIDVNASTDMIVSFIEQEIYRNELEKHKLEEEILKYEAQLSSIDEQDQSAQLVSGIDGVVVDVNKELGNPIVTIASNELAIEGQFTEKQLTKAEAGMEITAKASGKKMEGTLDKINPYPMKDPAIGQKNAYTFTASILEQPEALPIGTKAAVTVVTAEALGVATLKDKAIHDGKKSFVYQLNKNGLITKNTVETGLSFDGVSEIVDGAENGNMIAVNTLGHMKDKANFVTEMKPGKVTKASLKDLSKKEMLKAFLVGLIER